MQRHAITWSKRQAVAVEFQHEQIGVDRLHRRTAWAVVGPVEIMVDGSSGA